MLFLLAPEKGNLCDNNFFIGQNMFFGLFKKKPNVLKQSEDIIKVEHDRLSKTTANIGKLHQHGAMIRRAQDNFDDRVEQFKCQVDEIENYLEANPNMRFDSQVVSDMEDTINALEGMLERRKSKELGQGESKYDAIYRQKRKEYQDQYIDVDILATDGSFESLHQSAVQYSEKYQVNLNENIANLLSSQEKRALHDLIEKDFKIKRPQLDGSDYVLAATCGLIAGIVDVLFVGAPGEGVLTKKVDAMVDKAVEGFARLHGWPNGKNIDDIANPTASAIGYLERIYKVNYDQSISTQVDRAFNLSPSNHHLKNLAHSPDLIGLFFSIVDQFNSTSHFASNGQIFVIDTQEMELRGTTLIGKILCGIANWFGHLMSDVAGSSGAQNRGSGIPIPFFNLTQLFGGFGAFGQHRQDFATICSKVFEQGYDLRHGIALAIPVAIAEGLVRLVRAIKLFYIEKQPFDLSLLSDNNAETRRMLLVAHGSLLAVDFTDAFIRSKGSIVNLLLRSNIIALYRFSFLAFQEARNYLLKGGIDEDKVDEYLDKEYRNLLKDLRAYGT